MDLLFTIGFFSVNTKSYSLNIDFYDYNYDNSDKNNIKWYDTIMKMTETLDISVSIFILEHGEKLQ